jgi:hypothetical protein
MSRLLGVDRALSAALRAVVLTVSASVLALGCAPPAEEADQTAPVAGETPSGITVTPLAGSPEYADSSLSLTNIKDGDDLEGPAIPFTFAVANYDLGVQTADAATKGLANSAEGQHIHLILDNHPYSAHYQPSFEHPLEPGHYVALAFLSRSYHESVKNPNAYVLTHFSVGGAEHPTDLDPSAPHLFYSRPKGTYSGADTARLLLDFYLVNVELAADGNKVRATINGDEHVLSNWQPYVIEGLPMGEATIRLELIDATGNPIPGPFNDVTRTVTLEP